ncbi:Peptidase S11 D-alanyl-D-alanine carboxypeptidase A N-terminal domain-containing protein [Kibdelosporangium persicum]|uniref:D-alanyl-D-alanine carboxypeptidase DacB n=1 Tax=Kibdelosporangium persicum TaxID=2698649 RepID=A0ABX2F020_9PSEU|nr:D-alanyl-D-alanine carboxypeptidase DacB [Kibdelosporangium persicum]
MVLTSRRLVAVLLAALCLFASASLTAAAQPNDSCPNKTAPPPPVDTSENPPPGQPSPSPVPVPEKPSGGPRMGECGVVVPSGAAAPPADVTTASWIVADLTTGDVVGAKDPHGRQRPASLVKVLLAMAVLDELDMSKVVTGTQQDANQQGTKVGMGPGGQYTVNQLFLALLMHSANDAAHALAVQLGGVEQTVRKMNAIARKLGAQDTQVATPSGLDGPGMMTSAYDMALFYREAMKNPEFGKAVATKQIDWPGYGTKAGFKVNNDNRLLGRYQGFLGGKTGFTDDARHTYLGGAEQKGRRLVVVLLRGEQQPVRITDQASKLLTWGFAAVGRNAEPVGTLNTPPQRTPSPAESEGALANGGVSGTGTSAGPIDNTSGVLPTAAMSISGVTILGFLVWRIRRRYARPALPAGPRRETDPEQTVQLDRIDPLFRED